MEFPKWGARLDDEPVQHPSRLRTDDSPNLFPRLYTEVKQERKDLCNNPISSEDYLCKSPDLVFLGISSFLSIGDLYNLATLNKSLRRRCLATTSFQLLVRDRLSETLAVAFPSEYPPSPMPEGFPHRGPAGDRLFYGHHVFKSDSKHNRQRIFNIISQMQKQYTIKATEAGYLEGPNSETMQDNLRDMVDAWRKDLESPKFIEGNVQKVLIEAREIVQGRVA